MRTAKKNCAKPYEAIAYRPCRRPRTLRGNRAGGYLLFTCSYRDRERRNPRIHPGFIRMNPGIPSEVPSRVALGECPASDRQRLLGNIRMSAPSTAWAVQFRRCPQPRIASSLSRAGRVFSYARQRPSRAIRMPFGTSKHHPPPWSVGSGSLPGTRRRRSMPSGWDSWPSASYNHARSPSNTTHCPRIMRTKGSALAASVGS